MNFFKEWLGQLGIKSEVDREDNKLTDVILRGQLRRLPVGLVRRARPRLDAELHDLRPARRVVRLVVLQPGVRQALRAAEHARWTTPRGQADVKKMQQMLFEDSPYLVTVYTGIGEAVRSDRFACLQPQPDPGGIWLFQYGAHNYLSSARRTRRRRLRRRDQRRPRRPPAARTRA